MGCDLCEAKKTLHGVRYIGKQIFVIECQSCKKPMAVSVDHKKEFTNDEKTLIQHIFYRDLRLQGVIDWKMRTIKDHAHCHLR